MKILTNKTYNELLDTIHRLTADKFELRDKCNDLEKKLEERKSDCSMNNGKPFCSVCSYSYKYEEYYGTNVDKYGCLLCVPCSDFDRKLGNEDVFVNIPTSEYRNV